MRAYLRDHKDWMSNPRGRAREEAVLAVQALQSGHVQMKEDVPIEIRRMMEEAVLVEHGELLCLHGQTPMKVRIEVKDDVGE